MKLAVVAPAATVMEAGTVTAVLLLVKSTMDPPVAPTALTVTVQASVVDPVMEVFTQVMPFASGRPVPLRLIAIVEPVELLLLLGIVNLPVAVPPTVGSNVTLRTVDCPGFSVTGKVEPVKVNPAPVIAGALMVSGWAPVELKVRVFVEGLVVPTLPNDTEVALGVKTVVEGNI